MVMERISMRKIKEVLRLRFENKLSKKKIARCCNIGKGTVVRYINRFRDAGLTWPLPEEVTEEILEQKLYPKAEVKRKAKRDPLDYGYLVQEMKRTDVPVTRQLLWEEYRQEHPDGYSYAQFCNLCRAYVKTLNYSMRQIHKAGEKVFVDFGKGLKVIDPKTGEAISTSLFVTVWGASHYIFAAAVL